MIKDGLRFPLLLVPAVVVAAAVWQCCCRCGGGGATFVIHVVVGLFPTTHAGDGIGYCSFEHFCEQGWAALSIAFGACCCCRLYQSAAALALWRLFFCGLPCC